MSEERKIAAGVKAMIFEIVAGIDPKYRAAGKEALTESWMMDGLEVIIKSDGVELHGKWTNCNPSGKLAKGLDKWLGCVTVVLQQRRGVYKP